MHIKQSFRLCAALVGTCFVPAAFAQDNYNYDGVFEGIVDGRAFIRTEQIPDARWTVESFTQFQNGTPSAGDWIRATVDRYGRLLSVQIEEYPSRFAATVDHTDGLTIAARTDNGMVYLQDVPTTWHIGVEPGGLAQGDQIDVASYRNQTLGYLRLDARGAAMPGMPPATGPAGGLGGVNDSAYANDDQAIATSSEPPPLPFYDIPPVDEPDALWIPGYWAWGPYGFYWVPGVWGMAPIPGLLWTPAYWAFEGGFYRFHHGYWGTHVGYYGGINYGGGYYGEGYAGGRWHHGHVEYNTAVVRVNERNIHSTYVNDSINLRGHSTTIKDVTPHDGEIRHSFNGPKGEHAKPSADEQQWSRETHIKPTVAQVQQVQNAQNNPQLQHSQNHGLPGITTQAHLPAVVLPHTGVNPAPSNNSGMRPDFSQRLGMPVPDPKAHNEAPTPTPAPPSVSRPVSPSSDTRFNNEPAPHVSTPSRPAPMTTPPPLTPPAPPAYHNQPHEPPHTPFAQPAPTRVAPSAPAAQPAPAHVAPPRPEPAEEHKAHP